MTDLKTKLAALHPNMTGGEWDYFQSNINPDKWYVGNGSWAHVATEIGSGHSETNAEWIALTGSEANRAQIIAALDAVEECERLRDVVRVAAKWFEQAAINHEIAAEVAGPNENAAYVEAARRDTSRG